MDFITVSFGWIFWNFGNQLFSKSTSDKYVCSLKAFMRFYQFFEFLTKTLFWNILHKSSENNCDEVLFKWSCSLRLNQKEDFIIVSFCWILWNFLGQFFSWTSSVKYFCSFKAFRRFTSVLIQNRIMKSLANFIRK